MTNILTMIAYIFIGVIITLLSLTILVMRNHMKNIRLELEQELFYKEVLLENLSEALDKLEQKPVEQTDGFLKFITESRDYAFSFIESMQDAINEFENDTKEVFEKQRLSADIKTIKTAYGKLKSKTLPDNIPNN